MIPLYRHSHDLARALTTLLFTACICILAPASAQADTPRDIQRFALIIGANDGGTDRVELRYAVKDARTFADVLTEIGGVRTDRMTLLIEPPRPRLEAALNELEARVRASGAARTQIIVYYSGHSDESGLLLGEDRYGYKQLRERLAAMRADVRVVILDSCASGNLTRTKGGRRAPAFLSDNSTDVSGHAFLTSSAEDEAAQESDRVEGSFFTHYLISGLRGAADTTGDRRVTLNEVYQFAFQETLQRTERTMGGAQHPAYDIQLSGHGDLVLTDYAQGTAVLRLSEDLSGRLYIRRADGSLVAELSKQAGKTMDLGLPPSRYRVQLARGGHAGEARLKLKAGGSEVLTPSMFRELPVEVTAMRGATAPETTPLIPVGIDLLPWIGTSSGWPDGRRTFSLNILGGVSGGLYGLEIGALTNIIRGTARGVQLGGVANIVSEQTLGAQLAGVANLTSGSARGAQIGTLNVTHDILKGTQLGAFNIVGGHIKGAQLGVANIELGRQTSSAAQVGAVNVSRAMKGMRWGVVNVGLDDISGFSLGVVNVTTGAHRGFSLGVINVATEPVDGFSFGVVNTAPEADASFGLLNVAWRGRWQPTVYTNWEGSVIAGIKNTSGLTYNTFSVGAMSGLSGALSGLGAEGSDGAFRNYLIGWNWGMRTDLGASDFSIFGDLGAHWMLNETEDFTEVNIVSRLRFGMGYALTSKVSLHAGPSVNYMELQDPANNGISPIGAWELPSSGEGRRRFIWPGLFIGADFL